jgi:hypothetical protein
LKKAQILERCIEFGKNTDAELVDLNSAKFVPRFNVSRYGRAVDSIDINGAYDPSADLIGLDFEASQKVLQYTKMFDDETKGYVKIDGLMREVVWIAPFSATQKTHLDLAFDTYLVLRTFKTR